MPRSRPPPYPPKFRAETVSLYQTCDKAVNFATYALYKQGKGMWL